MPAPRKPARLYQIPKTGEWAIRDGSAFKRTGFSSERGQPAPSGAEEALAQYITERVMRGESPRDPTNVTVDEVLTLYVREVGPSVRGKAILGSNVRSLVPFWADLKCADVKGSTCRRYAKESGVTSGAARRHLGVLQAALNYAHREGFLLHPVAVTLPPNNPPRERFLTRGEAASLLRHSAPHLRRLILICLYTGTRPGAALALRWGPSLHSGWVDVDRGIIHRKGAREGESNKRRGSVRMPRQLAAHMCRWEKSGGSHVIMFRGNPIKSIKTAMRSACKGAELEEVSPHTLKHTAVTWAFQKGMTREDAAEYFSTSAKTLESTYRQHSPEHQQRAAEIMERKD